METAPVVAGAILRRAEIALRVWRKSAAFQHAGRVVDQSWHFVVADEGRATVEDLGRADALRNGRLASVEADDLVGRIERALERVLGHQLVDAGLQVPALRARLAVGADDARAALDV